jgi:hypothetical protein
MQAQTVDEFDAAMAVCLHRGYELRGASDRERSAMAWGTSMITNPEGWQPVAGGCNAVETPGRGVLILSIPEGCQRSATPSESAGLLGTAVRRSSLRYDPPATIWQASGLLGVRRRTNQRIAPMRRSAFRFVPHSGGLVALLIKWAVRDSVAAVLGRLKHILFSKQSEEVAVAIDAYLTNHFNAETRRAQRFAERGRSRVLGSAFLGALCVSALQFAVAGLLTMPVSALSCDPSNSIRPCHPSAGRHHRFRRSAPTNISHRDCRPDAGFGCVSSGPWA